MSDEERRRIMHEFGDALTVARGLIAQAVKALPEGAVRSDLEEAERAIDRACQAVADLRRLAEKGRA